MSVAESQKLTLHFQFTFPGNIWKIKADTLTQNLALEIRQPEILQVSYFCLHAGNGEMLLQNYQPQERWWTGLEEAFNGLLLLHGYQSAKDTGRHQGISAIAETDGKTQWEKPALTFTGLLSQESLLSENAAGQLLEIELKTGAEKKYSYTREHAKTDIQAFEINRLQALQVPLPYLPTDTYYPLLQEFIRQKTGREAQQTIEYLETANHIMLSFYAGTDTVVANFLMVCDAGGTLLSEICLQAEVAGQGSDTFFIFANKLIFIQEKTSLACYLL